MVPTRFATSSCHFKQELHRASETEGCVQTMPKVFIVDDDKFIREWFSLELSELGYEVVSAESCNNLIDKIEIYQPDLIVLDIKMGGCDGLEMLQEIREYYADLPVIICSAYDSYRYDLKTIAADYFITKSGDLAELKLKINRTLEASVPILDNSLG